MDDARPTSTASQDTQAFSAGIEATAAVLNVKARRERDLRQDGYNERQMRNLRRHPAICSDCYAQLNLNSLLRAARAGDPYTCGCGRVLLRGASS